MLTTSLVSEPITTSKFKIYDIDELPRIILGIQVKSKYDEIRLSIKPEYNPVYVTHFCMGRCFEPVYFYGVEIEPKAEFDNLVEDIRSESFFSKGESFDSVTPSYKKLLQKHNLSCESCFGYLADGIFPIDIDKLNLLSKKDYTSEIKNGFQDLVNTSEYPWYVNLINFNIFVISESFGYGVDLELNTLKEKK